MLSTLEFSHALFPRGLVGYVGGGLLVGAAIGVAYLVTGRVAGLSSYLTSVQSYWSRHPFFRRPERLEERRWKGVLVGGLVLGSGLSVMLWSEPFVTEVQPWRLALGGLFVGYGTRWARGCTSGHGICGLASAARPSLASTLAFFGTAIAVAQSLRALEVTP